MKNKFVQPVMAIMMLAVVTISCKKEADSELQGGALENTKWLLTKEILFFSNGNMEIYTRNSVWTFSPNHKLKILNPDSYIVEEKGEWFKTTNNKIATTINNDGIWQYTRNYQIISETSSYMRLNVEDMTIESSDNGKTTGVHYELIKL